MAYDRSDRGRYDPYNRERDERDRFDRERSRRDDESFRSEGYRDYGDRYGRPYSSPIERERFDVGGSTSEFGRGPAFQPYARGSQEFGPEGYGSSYAYEPAVFRREFASESWRVPGPYAGRGPKGYTRPDEGIREEVNDRLTAHALIDATDVEVQIRNGEVTLTGFVDSRDAKRVAEECAENIRGVREVHNRLRVRSHAGEQHERGVGRTSVLGLTEREMQDRSRARNT
jgi:hypothetical protein